MRRAVRAGLAIVGLASIAYGWSGMCAAPPADQERVDLGDGGYVQTEHVLVDTSLDRTLAMAAGIVLVFVAAQPRRRRRAGRS